MTKRTKKPLSLFWVCAVFVSLLAVPLLMLQNPTSLDDGLRHYVYANELRQHGIFSMPGWSRFLYEGTMSRLHVDPWFLSDIVLAPFTVFPVSIALKLFTLMEAAFLLGVFFVLLRTMRLRSFAPMYFFLLLFGNPFFLSRLLLGRPFPLLTGMFLLTLWALLAGRWKTLAVILGVSVLLSHLFVFPLALALARLGWLMIFERRSPDVAPLAVAIILGIVGGFLLHPQRTDDLIYLFTVFIKIPFQRSLTLGNELAYGYDRTWAYLALPFLIAVGLVMMALQKKRSSDRPWILFLSTVTSALFLVQGLWLRTIDFLWPTLLTLIAFIHSQHKDVFRNAREFFLPRGFHGPIIMNALMLLCIVQSIGIGTALFRNDHSRSLDRYRVIEAVPSGKRVLNVQWDSFPPFLLLRPDLIYATGMDPTFLYLENREGHTLLTQFDQGRIGGTGGIMSMDRWIERLDAAMPSEYLVVPNKPEHRFTELRGSTRLQFMTSTGSFAVFRISE